MNKKKSKALAFLLAASLLVPSANGVVSAAELRNDNNQYKELRREIAEDTVAIINGIEYKTLEDAINKVESNQTIQIVKDISINKKFNLTDKENVTIEGIIVNEKRPVFKINGQSGNVTFTVGEGFSVKNIEMRVVEVDLQDTIVRVNKGVKSISIENCYFSVDGKCKYITNLVQANNSSLILKNNVVIAPALRAFVNPSNGSEIIDNSINLMENGKKNAAISFSGTIDVAKIEKNRFFKLDRAIGFDDAKTNGENIIIKNNKFEEINWDFKINMDPKFNKGAKFDFSGNYYEKNGIGSTPRIMDDKNDSEIKFEEYEDVNIIVGPCYGNIIMSPNDLVHAGVATVNGKDYPTLEKAIKAATEGTDKTVKLVSDIEVDTWKQIGNIKGITIDGTKNKDEKYTIKVTNKIESNQNHDAVLLSAGGNEFKNLIIDLSELKEGSKQQGVRAISASEGDKIENVTIKGNKFVSHGIVVDKNCKKIEVKESDISNCFNGIYFATENNNVGENISVDGNTFTNCEFASILFPNNLSFVNNTLNNSQLNVIKSGTEIISNNFNGSSKIEFYEGARFTNNSVENAENFIDIKGSDKEQVFNDLVLEENYWGNEKPNFNKIIIGMNNLTEEQKEKFEPYYADEGKTQLKNEKHSINLKVIGEGWTHTEPQIAKEGEVVKLTLEPSKGWYLSSVKSKDVNLKKESKYVYTFVMPDKDILLDIIFEKEGTGIPSKPIKPTYDHARIVGSDRYETAGKIADKLGSYDTAVLVNATSTMSDGLSAAGLAGKEDAAILLVKKDSIPKATMDRLSKVKKVYIIGGENAISQKVVNQLKKNNVKVNVERLGGKTRVETSELVAKEIGSYKKAFVVNGFKGEADAMSASSVAAREEAPILLTNGKSSKEDRKSGVSYYVVGGKSVMNDSIVKKYKAERISGDDRYETNREMINEFYGASETLYFANGETLVDALTASTIAKDDGLVLVGRKSDNKILNKKNTIQVGGMKFDVDFEK